MWRAGAAVTRARSAFALAGVVAVVGCTSLPVAPLEHEVLADSALGRTIVRDAGAPVQTDSLVHHLTGQDGWYQVEIPFRFRNDTGATISVIHCRGGLNVSLEKRVGDGWETFYQPVLLMCLSQPIVIEPGDVYADTARIHGTLPGRGAMPEFASPELDGEYRLVWDNLVHDYDPDGVRGEPVGPLRSNPLLLVAPR